MVEVLPTSIWDTSSNMIKAKIAKLKFDPRSTEDTTLCDFVINVIHCNSRQNLQSVCDLKCVLTCLRSVISHYVSLLPLKFPSFFHFSTSKVCQLHVESCEDQEDLEDPAKCWGLSQLEDLEKNGLLHFKFHNMNVMNLRSSISSVSNI